MAFKRKSEKVPPLGGMPEGADEITGKGTAVISKGSKKSSAKGSTGGSGVHVASSKVMSSTMSFTAYKGRLGDLLLEKNLITQDQLDQALAQQSESGGKLGEVLVASARSTRSRWHTRSPRSSDSSWRTFVATTSTPR